MKSHRMCALLCLSALLLATGCAGSKQSSQQPAQQQDTTPTTLFDGSGLEGWKMAGPGQFVVQPDGSLMSEGGMGLLYYAERPFRDFALELDWKAETDSTNSGIFVRFPEQTDDPWYAVNNGYEIQIDGHSDPEHATGSVYSFAAPFRQAARPAGEWNTYRIKVTGQRYEIFLNGEKVNDFVGDRGREGYIGLQNHDDNSKVWFRNIRVEPVAEAEAPESVAALFAVKDQRQPLRVLVVTATQGFRHEPAIEKIKQVLPALNETTEFQFDLTEDLTQLNPGNLDQYDVLLLANATLRVQGSRKPWRTYNVTLATPGDTLDVVVALAGEPGNLAGTIRFEENDAADLEDVQLQGNQLSFTFPGPQGRRAEAKATLEGEAWDGTVLFGGNELPLKGTLASSSEDGPATEEQGVTEAEEQAILGFLRAGKGLAVAHAGLDALYEWPEYREIVGGGLFKEHPWTQSVHINIEDPENPAVAHLGDDFWIRDEIYVLDQNPRWNSHVLASLDMKSVGIEPGPADMTANDYPISWIRKYDGGRVFVTKLGHFADVWGNPAYLEHVLQGLRIAAGRIPADFSGHRVKEVISEGVWPDDIAVDERGNVWIAELRGKVHRYDAESGETQQIALIETTDPTKIEHGLFGIEVDPNFYSGEPYVYLYYAEPETFINTLARFEYRDGQLDLSTRKVLLRVPTEPQCCHQAGDLEWGPNGTLFLSAGDTGMSEVQPSWEISEERIEAFKQKHNLKDIHWSRLVDSERSAQNLQDLRGKILRINKDGTIPKDNPFYGVPGVRWEIYAYGLRNPYRFKYDDETGIVYIGVVGPDAVFDYDEYNISAKGGENFGWPRTLGRLFYNEWKPDMIPGYTPPLWEYTYESGGRSATVGPIYRYEGSGAFPAVFKDKIFIFDWARRWIKWADVEDGTFASDTTNDQKQPPWKVDLPAKRFMNIKTFDQLTTTAPIAMELGPDGSLYVAEFDGFWDAGPNARVTRYRWVTEEEAPVGNNATPKPTPGQR